MDKVSANKIKPLIIGGGIGGLTLSLALQKEGIHSEIYESATEINEVGAGIMLASNAMQIFKSLGLYDRLLELGNPISVMKITRPNFYPITSIQLRKYENKYGVRNISIHRAVLQKVLMDEVGSTVHLDHRLESVKSNKTGLQLRFKVGELLSNCVIGADGIHSTIRQSLLPHSEVRSAKQNCWRGICKMTLPNEYHHVSIEAWGRGKRFGFNRIDDKQVYWYALSNSNRDHDHQLEGLFDDFHPLVCEIIKQTDPDSIIENKIIDLKPIKTWYGSHFCLVGDAAHATTPNMGQGACQAIEDAWVLSKCFSNKNAFAHYQKIRRKKAYQVVRRSWGIGKLSQLENSAIIALRNRLMSWTPDAISTRQMGSLFDLKY